MRGRRDAASPGSTRSAPSPRRLPDVAAVATSTPGVGRGHRARRAALLADGPPRPLPGVGRRRRGLVLTHVDLDGARLLRRAAAASAYAWIPDGHVDPWVDHAARRPTTRPTAAPATGRSTRRTPRRCPDDAFVTRLRSLREAERFIAAGIPLVASISFGPGRAGGAPISSTNGHLLVIVGFTPPATSSSTTRPRRTRGRAAHLRPRPVRGRLDPRSGGLVYVIRRRDPLPAERRDPQTRRVGALPQTRRAGAVGTSPAWLADRGRATRRVPTATRRVTPALGAVNSTACQPVAPSGSTPRSTPVCTSPSCRSRGPGRRGRPARPSTVAAHCTQVSSVGARPSSARLPSPPSSATSTASMPVCWAQATPPIAHRARRATSAPERGHVDPRGHLDRPVLGPAALGPVGREPVEAGDLEVHDPLARRDVPVEPGHDRPHREAVVDRQRLAVHRDREHRVAVVGQRDERGAAGPAVVRGLQHGVGVGVHAGLGEQVGEPDAAPPGVADQRCRRPGWRRS